MKQYEVIISNDLSYYYIYYVLHMDKRTHDLKVLTNKPLYSTFTKQVQSFVKLNDNKYDRYESVWTLFVL